MEARAIARHIRMSPRKVRLVVDLIRGRSVNDAITILRFSPKAAAVPVGKTLRSAVTQIIVADVSMSLDNVLAVAGIARDHLWILIFGLALSIAFMGLAAALIARVLARNHWIGYLGLAVIIYVSFSMIYEGAIQIMGAMS